MTKGVQRETYKILREKREGGLELLYERYGKKLYSYGLASWNLTEDDAWEIVYATLYKVVEKINNYEFASESKFSSFIFTVFCNLLRRNYRDTKRRQEHLSFTTFNESLFEESHRDPSLSAERKVQEKLINLAVDSYQDDGGQENVYLKCLEDALDEMEDWQRILLLQRSQNMPYTQIAEFIDKPAGQLKVYHQRARAKLVKIFYEKVNAITQG